MMKMAFILALTIAYDMALQINGEWNLGFHLCLVWTGCDVILSTASIMHLCSIALYRYYGIANPLRGRNYKKGKVTKLIVPAWIVSIALSIPFVVQACIDPSNVFEKIFEMKETAPWLNGSLLLNFPIDDDGFTYDSRFLVKIDVTQKINFNQLLNNVLNEIQQIKHNQSSNVQLNSKLFRGINKYITSNKTSGILRSWIMSRIVDSSKNICGIYNRTFAVYSSLVSFFIPLIVITVVDILSIQSLRKKADLPYPNHLICKSGVCCNKLGGTFYSLRSKLSSPPASKSPCFANMCKKFGGKRSKFIYKMVAKRNKKRHEIVTNDAFHTKTKFQSDQLKSHLSKQPEDNPTKHNECSTESWSTIVAVEDDKIKDDKIQNHSNDLNTYWRHKQRLQQQHRFQQTCILKTEQTPRHQKPNQGVPSKQPQYFHEKFYHTHQNHRHKQKYHRYPNMQLSLCDHQQKQQNHTARDLLETLPSATSNMPTALATPTTTTTTTSTTTTKIPPTTTTSITVSTSTTSLEPANLTKSTKTLIATIPVLSTEHTQPCLIIRNKFRPAPDSRIVTSISNKDLIYFYNTNSELLHNVMNDEIINYNQNDNSDAIHINKSALILVNRPNYKPVSSVTITSDDNVDNNKYNNYPNASNYFEQYNCEEHKTFNRCRDTNIHSMSSNDLKNTNKFKIHSENNIYRCNYNKNTIDFNENENINKCGICINNLNLADLPFKPLLTCTFDYPNCNFATDNNRTNCKNITINNDKYKNQLYTSACVNTKSSKSNTIANFNKITKCNKNNEAHEIKNVGKCCKDDNTPSNFNGSTHNEGLKNNSSNKIYVEMGHLVNEILSVGVKSKWNVKCHHFDNDENEKIINDVIEDVVIANKYCTDNGHDNSDGCKDCMVSNKGDENVDDDNDDDFDVNVDNDDDFDVDDDDADAAAHSSNTGGINRSNNARLQKVTSSNNNRPKANNNKRGLLGGPNFAKKSSQICLKVSNKSNEKEETNVKNVPFRKSSLWHCTFENDDLNIKMRRMFEKKRNRTKNKINCQSYSNNKICKNSNNSYNEKLKQLNHDTVASNCNTKDNLNIMSNKLNICIDPGNLLFVRNDFLKKKLHVQHQHHQQQQHIYVNANIDKGNRRNYVSTKRLMHKKIHLNSFLSFSSSLLPNSSPPSTRKMIRAQPNLNIHTMNNFNSNDTNDITNYQTMASTTNVRTISTTSFIQSHTKSRFYLDVLASEDSCKINGRERRAEKTLIWVFAAFVFLWLPFFSANLVYGLCSSPSCQIPPALFQTFVWLGYLSSGVNPCIYTFLNKDFRTAFYKLLTCKLRGRKKIVRRKNARRVVGASIGSEWPFRYRGESNPRHYSAPACS